MGEVESSADHLSQDIHDDAKIFVLGILALFDSSKYNTRPTPLRVWFRVFREKVLPFPVIMRKSHVAWSAGDISHAGRHQIMPVSK